MTPEKKQARKDRNKAAKVTRAAARQANLALVGQLVYEEVVGIDLETTDGPTEIKALALPPAIRTARDGSILPLKNRMPRSVSALAFIGAKMYPQHGPQSKTRPGNKELHGEAIVELHSRSLAAEIDKASAPEGTPIPVIPMDAASEAAQL